MLVDISSLPPNVVIQVTYIACSWQFFKIPILQSPHDVALITRTCQLHTALELLHENGGSEHQAAWHVELLDASKYILIGLF